MIFVKTRQHQVKTGGTVLGYIADYEKMFSNHVLKLIAAQVRDHIQQEACSVHPGHMNEIEMTFPDYSMEPGAQFSMEITRACCEPFRQKIDERYGEAIALMKKERQNNP